MPSGGFFAAPSAVEKSGRWVVVARAYSSTIGGNMSAELRIFVMFVKRHDVCLLFAKRYGDLEFQGILSENSMATASSIAPAP